MPDSKVRMPKKLTFAIESELHNYSDNHLKYTLTRALTLGRVRIAYGSNED